MPAEDRDRSRERRPSHSPDRNREERRPRRRFDDGPSDDHASKRRRGWDELDDDRSNSNTRDDTPVAAAAASAAVSLDSRLEHAARIAQENALRIAQDIARRNGAPGSPGASSASLAPGSVTSAATIKETTLSADGDYKTVYHHEIKGPGGSEFIVDIEINDIKNRYMLTKGETQKRIKTETEAEVITRGKYYPDKALATERDPPLYLHIVALTQESLDKAVKRVHDMIEDTKHAVAGISDYGRRPMGPSGGRGDAGGSDRPPRQFLEAKVFVGIDDPVFNARPKIVGQGGQFVKHIENETRTRVQLKGRGSGYIDSITGQEAPEDLHIYISGQDADDIERAKKLADDLIQTVRADHERMKMRRVQESGPMGDRRDGGYGSRPPGQDRGRDSYGGRNDYRDNRNRGPPPSNYPLPQMSGYPGYPDPNAGAAAAAPPGGQDAQWQAYYQQYGYDANAWYQQQQQWANYQWTPEQIAQWQQQYGQAATDAPPAAAAPTEQHPAPPPPGQ
ncbi:hypothetical protein SeMB42_g02208 [Synchytrium endobioticum]|uniref:K Homology domain-containing protein n=1 Tax=Synchytrium endobioticum TaxID=286115 RepID=A0A507DEM1_9FUNG|nr:hypothetical protein SeLEV6574_g01123 [Synchytrium endobioticum]TPX50588.1 hypothetical protein SeMB42_g02208 [Synchytrium endobioticum]